jgi:hypothetical protein
VSRVAARALAAERVVPAPGSRRLQRSNTVQTSRPTIVHYTDTLPPDNRYPERIVSPTQPSACCTASMASLGAPEMDTRWIFQYVRCRTCGFTVRRIVRGRPDEARLTSLREAHSFVRRRHDRM